MEFTKAFETIKANGIEANLVTVNKNGVKKQGITVGSGTIRPTIYEEHVEFIQSEYRLMQFINGILEDIPDISIEQIVTKEFALEHCVTRLQRPTDAPIVKRNFLDLEEYVVVDIPDEGSYKVTPQMLEQWEITDDEFFNKAKANGWGDFEAMGIGEIVDIPDNFGGMVVISKKSHHYGAVVMTYLENVFKDKGEYYILPSSIHEFIMMPAKYVEDVDILRNMVKEVNDETVDPQDLLSYSVYYFDGETLKIAE